jgi:hypothetical protein
VTLKFIVCLVVQSSRRRWRRLAKNGLGLELSGIPGLVLGGDRFCGHPEK